MSKVDDWLKPGAMVPVTCESVQILINHIKEIRGIKEPVKTKMEILSIKDFNVRDYFAAKAMQGILFEGLDENQTARHAYEIADAMLKAREQ